MANRRQSLTILIVYFIIYALPSLLVAIFKHLGSQVFLIQTLDYLIGAVLLAWLATRPSTPNPIERHQQNWLITLLWGLAGFVIVVIVQAIVLQLDQWLGHSVASTNTSTLLTVGHQYPFFFLAIFVGAPIMEEIVFRKVIFGNLSSLIGPIGAALISSLFFSFAHADGHLILYALIGLCFCWLYRQTGRIQTSMLAHILMNALAIMSAIYHF
ncbi:CPBP family intramembrane glutamic endopeptidase [Lactiplantibacillus songbeiensis]|uniref:CPBP family intramembrane glutamic endopeptidase n=1 Tax=Lactiplantibacillus songbeiensis TaxID=2559920 RepID=A0ABW4BXE8_9LACO|nr:type II CAAX endopeptidase family protein [Lactiplantibacillus songbeiensis]